MSRMRRGGLAALLLWFAVAAMVPPAASAAGDPYRRWSSPMGYTCGTSGSLVFVRVHDNVVEFNELPAGAQYASTFVRNGVASTTGPLPVEQTSGTVTYGTVSVDFPSYPFTLGYRIDTLIDGRVVYRSALNITCAADGGGTVTPENEAVAATHDRYRRWLAPKSFGCSGAGTQPTFNISDLAVEFNDLPAGAQYTETFLTQNGVPSTAGASAVERTSGTIYYGGTFIKGFPSFPFTYRHRINTIIDGQVVYRSSLIATCTADGVGQAIIRNEVVPTPSAPPDALYVPLLPARLLDTRPAPTVDGAFSNVGALTAGSTVTLPVGGRADVPPDAQAVVINATASNSAQNGFVTIYPCGAPFPLASSLNIVAGRDIANAVAVPLGTDGTICLYSNQATDLIVDVAGFVPAASAYRPLVPARLLDTRVAPTVDGAFSGTGRLPAQSTFELQVVGRAGVDSTAAAAVLNVTVVDAAGPGFVTVFPCGQPQPTASNLNYVAGQTVPNMVITAIGAGGKVCFSTFDAIDLVVDVTGAIPGGTGFTALNPARLLDTRPSPTVDGVSTGWGIRLGGNTSRVQVAGRGGVPADATTAVLNVTAADAVDSGFLTVYPCDQSRPLASNVNYQAGSTVPNAVLVKLDVDGSVCIFNYATTHVLVDVSGAIT